MAEGLPAESFLDTGNRGAFGNGDGEVQLHPVFERCADIWEAEGYAPLTLTGAAVDVIRRTLAAQAALLRHRRTRRFGELLRAA